MVVPSFNVRICYSLSVKKSSPKMVAFLAPPNTAKPWSWCKRPCPRRSESAPPESERLHVGFIGVRCGPVTPFRVSCRTSLMVKELKDAILNCGQLRLNSMVNFNPQARHLPLDIFKQLREEALNHETFKQNQTNVATSAKSMR